ncbi:Endo-1,4-beta-xylanase, GH35 family [Microlunatus sagamiharensis]|uniref:endo-1,4-beta-xylanase n=1 Tax=Microlunatus sagamiharensis TaxID=546874 RepID=A0A1H2MCY8_9ACTN|nr:endo-1,4-beta-xylanase [Microlunatus sagamiharensis]SDU91049.1 Endo-1,4-beta-xylanase, GH35 family [Microlunatus sagamiharensis]
MPRRTTAALLGLALVSPLLLSSSAVAAPVRRVAPYDLDGDGHPEQVVGAPGLQVGTAKGAGGLVVLPASTKGLSTAGWTITQASAGVAGEPVADGHFASAVASADFDHDGYADLAVGATGEVGTVTLLHGSSKGLTGARSTVLRRAGDAGPDGFGASLVAADLDGDGWADLAVGAPYADPVEVPAEDHGASGSVTVLQGGPAGFSTARSSVLHGRRSGTDRDLLFGSSLATGDVDGDRRSDLVVASRGLAAGDGHAHAGSVTVCPAGGGCVPVPSSRGYPGLASLAVGDVSGFGRDEVVVGLVPAPGARSTEGGRVVTLAFSGTGAGLRAKETVLTRSTKGVPGSNHAGDDFGAALALGDVDRDGFADLLVGAPGEAVGGRRDAGRVTLVLGGRKGYRTSGNKAYDQDTRGVPGSAETRDRFGATVSLLDHDADGRLDLTVGAPGENGSGAVTTLDGSGAGLTTRGARTFGLERSGSSTPADAAFGAVLGGSPADPLLARRSVVDLLRQDWRHVPGVVGDGTRLRVRSTGKSIVEQDGGGGRPNPPVLLGTHLVAPEDFAVSVSFADVTADASLSVQDSPPVVADEFRIEPAGVRLTLRGDDLRVSVFDGSPRQDVRDPRPTQEEHVRLADPAAELSVRRSGDRLEIASGGRTVASLPRGDVFGSGRLWLGLSSEEGSFTVGSFTAAAPGGSTLAAAGPASARAQPSSAGLQALATRARPGFLVGAAVAPGPLAADADYADAFVSGFGALTPENVMKPQALSPRRGEYTFEEADALLDLARSKGVAVHGHTIAFSEAMPRWMQELPSGTEEERRASAAALLDYVTTVVTHFQGRLASLDVLNEPFDVDQGTSLQENTWYRVFGPGYPAVVSKAVHDADPDVRQFINENGADVPGPRQDALLRLARDTNAQGGHIAGVGLQAHVYDRGTDAISADDLATTFRNVGRAGLVARISENDVTDAEGRKAQASQFATVLKGCLRSTVCVSYTTWGVDDRYDWWLDDDGDLHQGHDLLFDGGKPTPAYDAVRKVLAG